MKLLWDAWWFFLPAGIANMAPMFASRLPVLRRWSLPIDFGKSYHGGRLLGDSKTWRGLLFGAFVAGLITLIQYKLVKTSPESLVFVFAIGAAMGFGALFGDAVESFFKRRLNHKPGESWFPFDQVDYIIGGLVFVYPFKPLAAKFILTILILYFVLHLIVSYIGYILKLKPSPI
jgi:CDP-2,3-bis-(O-geranylgeranyl)-sn-glycerol synthase